jgi:hypothetical protein
MIEISELNTGAPPPAIPPQDITGAMDISQTTFIKYSPKIQGIINDWKSTEDPKVKVRREVRKNLVNVNDKRQKEEILGDETIIPDHTINANVSAEKAKYVNYIESSRRLLIFKPPGDFPFQDKGEITNLEEAFTDGMRFNRWKLPWFKVFDGACLHGACAVEVIFDPSKPFNCAIDYVSRNDLRFQLNLKNIQAGEIIARRFEWTIIEVEAMAKRYGFKPEGVKYLEQITQDFASRTTSKMFEVYKVYFKIDGLVQVAWYTEHWTNGWLADPKPLELGLFEIDQITMMQAKQMGLPYAPPATPIDFYPFFPLKYDEQEDEIILDVPGRAALDIQAQEAITHAFSSLINGSIRAAGIYASTLPANNGDAPTDKVVGKLKHGVILDRPLNFFTPPWPNANVLLGTIQAISVRNQSQMGRTDFAALTRDDTEKTATEIQAAAKQTAALSSMQVDLLATVIIDVYELCYKIARCQVLLGLCKGYLTNNPELLFIDYSFKAAGDVEVVQRAEKQQALKEIWMIAKDTPAAQSVFEYILEVFFPNEAKDWIQELRLPKDTIISTLANALSLMRERAHLSPEENGQLENILSQAQAMVGGPGKQAASPQSSNAPQLPAPVDNSTQPAQP